MRISVCMIVKNEEENIRACLESIPGEVEVIIVDTGSTDRTTYIAESYANVRLFHCTWEGDFAKARNYSLSMARGTHIFVIDADERFQSATYRKIVDYVKKKPQIPAAIMIRNISNANEQCQVHRMVRLFPNQQKFRFHGSVHEVLYYDRSIASFIMSDIMINHFGYNQLSYRERKYGLYYDLYHKHLRNNPYDGYMWYQLGKLHASVDELEEACDAFIHASNCMKIPSLSHAAMVIEFAKLLRKAQLVDDAIDLLENNQKYYEDYPDLWFQLGLLYIDDGRIKQIPVAFNQALQIGESRKYATTEGVGSYLAAYNLGVFYEVTGELKEALAAYNLAKPYELAMVRTDTLNRGVIE
ncbi:glycosyltransferase [Paenibacillus sp. CR_12]|uniref:glycosyltransferase family 2 protein n=1 Tax=Paenibacillus sp. CR_12 TaxID=3055793 RepID=UPI0035BFCF4F